uniref:Protein FAM83A isoform X2 n=1 Tax=Geotrypetes seraphini TaxID=260995 RepID=A0A6P8QX98_GEOSA|nr:protein FAM83A isoform X2 [Geotrypetes seraphini]
MQPGEDVPQSFGPEKGAMKRSEHLGKIKKRLQDAKAQGAQPTKLDLSSNESGRLAIDALLDGGEEAYRRVLREEGEVDFLSAAESRYVLESCHAPPCSADAAAEDDENGSLCSWNPPRSESVEPLLLPGCNATDKHYLKDKTSTTFHFQDEKSNSIRESIRRCIHRTSQVLIIVMDEFTDIVIFCDILEAAHKRNVFVYLLLEHSKLKLFTEMCDMLQLEDIHLENIFVRSIMGEVYCAKSGKKFSGLNQEKFLISDWRFVLAGSYR